MPEDKPAKVVQYLDSKMKELEDYIRAEGQRIESCHKGIEDYQLKLEQARQKIVRFESELRQFQKARDVVVKEKIGQNPLEN